MSVTGGPPDLPPTATSQRAALDAAERTMERAWHEYSVAMDTGNATFGHLEQLHDAYLHALDTWIWAVRLDQRAREERQERAEEGRGNGDLRR